MMSNLPSASLNYDPMTLWADDIRQICEFLSKISNSVSLETSRSSFSDVETFIDKYKGYTLNDLEIKCVKPDVSLSLSRDSVRLFALSPDLEDLGVVYQMDRFLQSRLRKPAYLYQYFSPFPILYIDVIYFFYSDYEDKTASTLPFVIALFLCAWWLYIIEIRSNQRVILHIYEQHERQSPWQANLPSILIGVGCAVLGAILSFVLPHLFHNR